MKLYKRYMDEMEWNEVQDIEKEKERIGEAYIHVDAVLTSMVKPFDEFDENEFSFRLPFAMFRACP